MELADLDQRQQEEQKDIEHGALSDWEVRFARAKLDLKNKHYKVLYDENIIVDACRVSKICLKKYSRKILSKSKNYNFMLNPYFFMTALEDFYTKNGVLYSTFNICDIGSLPCACEVI